MALSREPYLTDVEEKAVRRVEKAIAALPKSIALYFNGSAASVVACDGDGRMLENGECSGYDRDAILDSIDTPRCEAGDW